jgi:hypothetical protein
MPQPKACVAKIGIAYRDLAAYQGAGVRLAAIRGHKALRRFSSEEVTAALIALKQASTKVHLLREVNQKTLTRADHDAAVEYGGRTLHKLAIEGMGGR